jgi:ubiquinone/menaquinone biosynthesis C-methylase UbiE
MDCTDLEFVNESFDVVIDKGTLDALACGKDFLMPCKMLTEVNRVLKVQGKFILVTH